MKAYNPKDWSKLIFHFHKSDSFRLLLPAMIGLVVYAGLLCYIEIELKWFKLRSTTVLHSLLGFVISLLLVFRTNTGYDRWWEGRKIWGDLVNNTRNLMMKYNAFIPEDKSQLKNEFRILISNYPLALKEHLRKGVNFELLEDHQSLRLDSIKNCVHIPNKIANQLFLETEKLKQEGIITDEKFILLNDELRSLTNVCGACERIKSTPIPYSYSTFIKRIIFLYVITLPLGLVDDFKYATIPMTLFVFYAFASLELIAEEIEDPFGYEDNDLPTDEIAERIKNNLKEIIN
jgi:putative membrane protein